MADVKWGYSQVVTVTATAAQVIPAVGAQVDGGRRRTSGELLIQPIDGKVRYAFDAAPDDEDAPAIGQDVQMRDSINNAVWLVRDNAEAANVKALVCYEVG